MMPKEASFFFPLKNYVFQWNIQELFVAAPTNCAYTAQPPLTLHLSLHFFYLI